ncbi:hypothetical protein BD626DRAFT_577956 [Schizophyllum amplum]|uniref:Uncharacterized protein n=1 Tax=Schizophyllum amplum TaxID=97359 RepID=A0A550BSA2_9AGAR|nr:hypothetical protein BD626DRAFT_577956 [Auriculariopsis ampla]
MASSYNDSTRYGAPPTTDALNFRPSARDSRADARRRAAAIRYERVRRKFHPSSLTFVLAPAAVDAPSRRVDFDFIILFRFTFTSHINFANTQLPSPVTPNTHFVNAARFSSTGSPSYESPEITARDTFRLFLTTTTPPLSSLRRVSSSSAVWTLGSMLCTPTTTLRTLLLIAADNGGDLGDIGVGRRDCRHTPIPSSSLESAPRSSLESAPRSSFESASGVVWSAGPWASRHTRDPVPRETPREFNFGSHRIIDLVGPRRRQRSMLEVDAGPAEVAHPAEVARPCHRRHARPSRPSPRHLPHPYNPTWRSKRRISAQEFSGTSASGAEGDNEDGGGLPRRRRVAPLRISQVTCFRGSSPPSPTPL